MSNSRTLSYGSYKYFISLEEIYINNQLAPLGTAIPAGMQVFMKQDRTFVILEDDSSAEVFAADLPNELDIYQCVQDNGLFAKLPSGDAVTVYEEKAWQNTKLRYLDGEEVPVNAAIIISKDKTTFYAVSEQRTVTQVYPINSTISLRLAEEPLKTFPARLGCELHDLEQTLATPSIENDAEVNQLANELAEIARAELVVIPTSTIDLNAPITSPASPPFDFSPSTFYQENNSNLLFASQSDRQNDLDNVLEKSCQLQH